MEVVLPPELVLASQTDISEVVGAIRRKLEVIDSHAEAPKPPPPEIPQELIEQMLKNELRRTGLTREQYLNQPYYPLVELVPVENLCRLAIRHWGAEAGINRYRNVAAVIRRHYPDGPFANAHIYETGSGFLRMLMERGRMRTYVADEPEDKPYTFQHATLADCLEITRQIEKSPGSRY